MESLERLREFVSKGSRTQITTLPPIDQVTLDWRDLTKLIDAIEEEFKEQELAHAFAYSQVYDFANGIYGQLLNFDKMEERQEEMAEHGWVKLPKDADGEVVRIGDVMVMASHPFGCEDKPLVVDRMELSRGMHGEVWCLALDTDRSCWTQAAVLRHHHEPTVEDVLHDFICEVEEDVRDEREIIAEYAAKLCLAGDE